MIERLSKLSKKDLDKEVYIFDQDNQYKVFEELRNSWKEYDTIKT